MQRLAWQFWEQNTKISWIKMSLDKTRGCVGCNVLRHIPPSAQTLCATSRSYKSVTRTCCCVPKRRGLSLDMASLKFKTGPKRSQINAISSWSPTARRAASPSWGRPTRTFCYYEIVSAKAIWLRVWACRTAKVLIQRYRAVQHTKLYKYE